MTDMGVSKPDCPLGLEVCFPSCHWWTKNGCRYDLFLEKERENHQAMNEASHLHRPPRK